MNIQETAKFAATILTNYYNNNIRLFLDSCHRDVLWIGPAEKQIIRTKAALVDAFSKEHHNLKFIMNNLTVTPISTGSNRTCEILLCFLVDTIWPDKSVSRVNQRVQLTFVEENGQPLIKMCHISNAITYDERDNIYPVHYDENYKHYTLAGEARSERLIIKSVNKSLLYLRWSRIIYVESLGSHTLIHTLDGDFESVENLLSMKKQFSDLFYQIHKCYLINPNHVRELIRFQVTMTDGTVLPVPEKKYTSVKAVLTKTST
nr:LytTR family DNA-binding domain-containing protein [uncultured Blautia sp.]